MLPNVSEAGQLQDCHFWSSYSVQFLMMISLVIAIVPYFCAIVPLGPLAVCATAPLDDLGIKDDQEAIIYSVGSFIETLRSGRLNAQAS